VIVVHEAGGRIGGTCAICTGTGTADDPLTADHVVSPRDGGSNDLSNLRAAHRSCNSSRGAHEQHLRSALNL
jgi:5-methylcytosine-specific restriction endonuclease McrA